MLEITDVSKTYGLNDSSVSTVDAVEERIDRFFGALFGAVAEGQIERDACRIQSESPSV